MLVAALLLATSAAPLTPVQDGAELDAANLAFFEKEVRPLLVEHCYECHSAGKRRPKGGLRLDLRSGWERGGDSGPALVPRDVEASRLVRAIRYADPEIEMPPDGKLPEHAITTLEDWVRRGAPDPRVEGELHASGDSQPDAPHWAFQPMADPTPPRVRDEGWVRNEIDSFVLARLEAEGLAPAGEAERRTLLRRATYDLTGLPATHAELERFAKDPAPDAWEREIERLLASPHYGERWGRMWLDLARYADSNGLDENFALANAWRYRDWVVRALNADLPYDRFLTQQLAGDLLPEPADDAALRDQLVATGFLALGPKMLAEQDKVKLELDVVDEQLDVAAQAFLGLTMGCARCHDHKFDPLSQRDYTALAGIFKSTSTMANLAFVSATRQRELASRTRIEARQAQLAEIEGVRKALDERFEAELAARRVVWHADLARYLLAAEDASRTALLVEAEDFSRGNLIVDRDTYGTVAEPIVRTGASSADAEGPQFTEYDLTFAAPARLRLEVRYAAEERRPMRVLVDGAVVATEALGEPTGGWNVPSQRWTGVALVSVRAGRNVLRFEREGAVPHLDALLLVPAESLEDVRWLTASPWADGLEPALVRGWVGRLERAARSGDPVFGPWARFASLAGPDFEREAAALRATLRDELAAEPARANALVARLLDGLAPASLRELALRYQTLFATLEEVWRTRAQPAGEPPGAEKLADPTQEELRQELLGAGGPFALRREEAEALFPEGARTALAAERARLAELERGVIPAFDLALGVQDAEHPVELPIHVRGSHQNLGPERIPRGFPAVLTAALPAPAIPAESSGRLELAAWLTHPEHPLTARVIANRVWLGHFGQGLVRTPSNFGRRGEPPTHPELLDWLARALVRDGWSLKALHRRILTSATYRMASVPSDEALARDPDNRLLARANRRRLDAEGVRDAVLARAGMLDLALGGSLLASKDGEYVTNDQSSDQARYASSRRSLYLPIVRNALYDFFAAFDYRDPSLPIEQRSATTTPAQALWLLNSSLVLDAARAIALELSTLRPQPEARVAGLYERVLGRAPDERERALALAFVARCEASPPTAGAVGAAAADSSLAWRGLAQTLFLSNEFLHVD